LQGEICKLQGEVKYLKVRLEKPISQPRTANHHRFVRRWQYPDVAFAVASPGLSLCTYADEALAVASPEPGYRIMLTLG
jgi:hypothetical protein